MCDRDDNKILILTDQLEAMKKLEINQFDGFDYPSNSATSKIDNEDDDKQECNLNPSYESSILSPISPSPVMILSPEIEDDDVDINTAYSSPASTVLDMDELFQYCNVIKRPTQYSLQEMKKEISEKIFPLRQDMCNWSFQVIDNYHIDREAVFLAFSYADRYVALLHSMITSDEYTLLCMTSLYIAMKVIVHTKKKVFLSWFVDMSRGAFTSDEFISMEKQILHTLHWKLHPPTATSFLRLYIDSIMSMGVPFNSSIMNHHKDYYVNQCRIYSECSMHDNYLSTIRPSIVSLASIYIVFTKNQINLDIDYDEEDNDDSDDKSCNRSSVCSSLYTKDLKTYYCDVMKVKDYLLTMRQLNN